MATEPANFAKTPAEIYGLASRSEQVLYAAKLLEFALREYSGDYRLGFAELYNTNRKVFPKALRDRIRPAFEVFQKLRHPAKYGEPDFESKTAATEALIAAAEFLFSSYRQIYPEKFWPSPDATRADDRFFDQGFESAPVSPGAVNAYGQVRQQAAHRDRQEVQQRETTGEITDHVSTTRNSVPSSPADSAVASSLSSEPAESEFEIPRYELTGPGGLFPPRLSLAQLEKTCHRMGRSLRAGINVVTAWETEGRGFNGQIGDAFANVREKIAHGETLHAAVVEQVCFPPMFCEMVRVGEETGRLDQAFLRLADHYRHLVQMRRTFISGITWPIFQFCAAIGVISLFFIALSVLEQVLPMFRAPDIFMLGLGPLGNLGLFWTFLILGGTGCFVAIKGTANGWFGQLPMQLALKIPLVGDTIRILALSRFAWSFGMAIEAGMDAERSIQLGVRSTHNPFYIVHEPEILESVGRGSDFHTALRRTGAFPDDFLQAVEVGELTGEITESLERLSDDYQEQAELLLRRISQICGFLVSLFVMGVVILLIVLLYMNYIGTLNDAISNPMGSLEQYKAGGTTTNPITAAKNQMVDQIMQSEDMKTITNMYEVMGRADEMQGDEFLDALLAPYENK